MSRAELRREAKKKTKIATYNLTEEQLDILVKRKVKEELAKIEKNSNEDILNTAMLLLLTLPLEVLMDHYWQKTYSKRIPEFTEYVLEYYKKWQDGELDLDKLREDLWEFGGVRLERTEG